MNGLICSSWYRTFVQRLSTIQKADVIFVLDGGKIVEQGDHASLVKKRGVYWQMVCVPPPGGLTLLHA